MSDIYVFSPDDDDYTTMGLACALTPTSCTFREQANGESAIEMSHPLDSFGRYTALQKENILTVPVPVRTTPEIQNGSVVTTVWTYRVKPANQYSSKMRTMYTSHEGGKAMKVIPGGETLTVVQKLLSENDEFDEDARWKVKTRYGTGWIKAGAIEEVQEHTIDDNSQSIEEVQSPWTVTRQFFRIYEVEKTLTEVKVKARHISYDLLYTITRRIVSSPPQMLSTVLNWVMTLTFSSHNFKAYTNVSNTYAGIQYMGRNLIDVFLNQEDGVCKNFDVSLVRDNYDLYFLHDPGLNRGVRIQYGKNMTGVTFTSSDENMALRVVPVGKKPMDRNKDGTVLFLCDNPERQPTKTAADPYGVQDYQTRDGDVDSGSSNRTKYFAFVDSPLYLAHPERYPVLHTYLLECENCEVDQEEEGVKLTKEQVRARMLAQAKKLFTDEHVDEPEITMKVEFLNLGDTEEYKQFKNLENCFVYDYVIVQHPDLDIDVTARIVSIEWDCLLDRMKSCEIGQVGKSLANTGITSWQIPSGISGSKIASESIGQSVLKDGIISARHIQTDTLNAGTVNAKKVITEEIQALVFNAVDAHADNITASNIATDTLAAGVAKIITAHMDNADVTNLRANLVNAIAAHIESLDASTITTDELYAQLATVAIAQITTANIQSANIDWAHITNLYAGVIDAIAANVQVGDFDFAAIQKLVADAMVISTAAAGTVGIDNLLVTSANMLNATISELVLKGNDDKYYTVNIDSEGDIYATETTVTNSEIIAGQTSAGKQIVDTNMNVAALNATTLTAQTAAIGSIVTAALTAEKITAGQALIASATIPTLYTTSIQALGNDLDLSANNSIRLMVGTEVSEAMVDATPAVLRIDSSRGTVFKNSQVTTVLSAVIYFGSERITTSSALTSLFGNGAYLQWKYQAVNESTWHVMSVSDSRFSDNGFTLTLSASDVDTKINFMCELIVPD